MPACVSIIIPVYKVAAYVGACLQSVYEQSYPAIEIIIVNDATPDDSMEQAEEWVRKLEEKFKVSIVTHPENRGLSAARNTGIRAATGDWIYFLDSDDAITPGCIGLLVQQMARYPEVDFVVGGVKVVGKNWKFPLACPEHVEGNEAILHGYATRQWYMLAVNHLYRKKYVMENNLYFREGLLHEDELYSFNVAATARSMAAVYEDTYIYKVREAGSITSQRKQKNLEDTLLINTEKFRHALLQWQAGIFAVPFSYCSDETFGAVLLIVKNQTINRKCKMRLIGDYKKIYVPLLPFKGRTKCSIRQKIKASVLALPVSFIYALLAIVSVADRHVRCISATLLTAAVCCVSWCVLLADRSSCFYMDFPDGYESALLERARNDFVNSLICPDTLCCDTTCYFDEDDIGGKTVVLEKGTYRGGKNFPNGMSIKNVVLLADGAVVDNCGGTPMIITGNAVVRGVKFVNSSAGSLAISCIDTACVTLEDCEFSCSVGASLGGLEARGGKIHLSHCRASGNIRDGFNYHAIQGQPASVFEENCASSGNGLHDEYFSHNGSTAHDACKILRYMCLHQNSRGGIIADVHNGTLSINIGCRVCCSDTANANPVFQTNYYCGDGAKMFLLSCTSSGSRYDVSCVDDATVCSDRPYPNIYEGSSHIYSLPERMKKRLLRLLDIFLKAFRFSAPSVERTALMPD